MPVEIRDAANCARPLRAEGHSIDRANLKVSMTKSFRHDQPCVTVVGRHSCKAMRYALGLILANAQVAALGSPWALESLCHNVALGYRTPRLPAYLAPGITLTTTAQSLFGAHAAR
jgi:hypothetical protein